MDPAPPPLPPRHSVIDDVQAFGSATLMIALGLHLVSSAGLLLGGVPGLAFLLRHLTGWSLGLCLFVVNTPFYVLAWRTLGRRFTFKTLVAMSLLSLLVEAVRGALVVQSVQPLLAAVGGGVLVGVGILALLRHRGSLGGIGVLALHLQRRRGWNVGAVQLLCDAVILGAAAAWVDTPRLAYSVVGAAAMNLVLLWNHRPGRYPAIAA